MTFKPFKATLGGGTIEGQVELKIHGNLVDLTMALKVNQLDMDGC